MLGPGVASEGYRTTARVAAGPNGAAGFRAERSHDVVPAPACLVLHPTLREQYGSKTARRAGIRAGGTIRLAHPALGVVDMPGAQADPAERGARVRVRDGGRVEPRHDRVRFQESPLLDQRGHTCDLRRGAFRCSRVRTPGDQLAQQAQSNLLCAFT